MKRNSAHRGSISKKQNDSYSWYLDEIAHVNSRLSEAYDFYGEMGRGPFVGIFYVDPSTGSIYSDRMILHTAYSMTPEGEPVDGAKSHASLWLSLPFIPGWKPTAHRSLPRGRISYRRSEGDFLLSAGKESRPFKKLIIAEFGLENSPVSCDFSANHYEMNPKSKHKKERAKK